MSTQLSIRFTAFALATAVTWTVFNGIDMLAAAQHAGTVQMSQAPAAMHLATDAASATIRA